MRSVERRRRRRSMEERVAMLFVARLKEVVD